MKETVSKTAKKTSSAAAPTARKTRASAAAPASAKAKATATPASRPAATKAAVSKPVAARKPAPVKKAVAPATKAVTKAAKPASKAAAKPATKVAAKPATKAATKSATKAAVKAPAKAVAAKPPRTTKQTTPAAARASSEQVANSGARTPGIGAGAAELADKMQTPVVSKVSEVMTKTTKPNNAAQARERTLTDDEIRAMSDEDYMNPAQLAFFKAKLQQLERDLLKNAGETTEHLRETVLVPDPADRATIEEEHALELRTRDRERKLLKKVQQSLASIDSGEYGWCEETGEPIGIPRLIARPTATLSLEAQQRRELKQKLYGD
jgi:DnaK suppressor protein